MHLETTSFDAASVSPPTPPARPARVHIVYTMVSNEIIALVIGLMFLAAAAGAVMRHIL